MTVICHSRGCNRESTSSCPRKNKPRRKPTMATKDQLIKDLQALPAQVEEVDYKRRGYHLEVTLEGARVRDLAQLMRDTDYYLVFVAGLHVAEGLEAIYQFGHYTLPCRVMVHARTDADGAVPTISDLYDGANWHERETRDMYGIVFSGHPYLQPLLLPEEDADLKPLLKSPAAL